MKAKPSFKNLPRDRRRAVAPSGADLVRTQPLFSDGGLPLLVEPRVEGVDLLAWAGRERERLSALLRDHGGLLLRGFDLLGAEPFERLVSAVSGEPLEYRERSSPRSEVSGRVYTSTEYPAHQEIFLHNENSYQHQWPMKLFFHCVIAPKVGGETPIADCRRVLSAIDPAVVERFAATGVMYVRNFSERLGLRWQDVFQTEDREEVEAYCRGAGIETEWRPDGVLRTRSRRAAVTVHPETGERLWFNHATFFHVSTLPEEVREGLLAQLAPADLPSHSFYGDGSPIEPEVMEELRAAYRRATVRFPWRVGDVLLLDNMLSAHGRAPFTGERRILVGMAEPMRAKDLATLPVTPEG